ncbi:MAG: dihydroorotase [Candidatus Marinimicrobia bacterium]|nr:dihydroorotase [Candidatus Neomarinimicrobiota bacterium]
MKNIKKIEDELILRNGKIIDPFNKKSFFKDIYIKNGKITNAKNISGKTRIIDCKGKIITHGFCDLRSHFCEPGKEDTENLETGSNAAMAGGFTRVCVMPNTSPPLDNPELINFIIKKAENYPINIHPIGAVTKMLKGKSLAEMSLMYDQGAVAFSDDDLPIQDGAIMRIALDYARLNNVPIINQAEDKYFSLDGQINEGFISNTLGLQGNPDLAESIMIHRDLQLATFLNSKIHIPHVSSIKSIKQIENFKKYNQNITAEVAPHHLYFNDEALLSYDTNLKVRPPIRTEMDRKALIKAVEDKIIDCIATDHTPQRIEEKETTFDLASFGMIGLESCFGAVNKSLVIEGNLKLEQLINLLTINPRKIMGFNSDLLSENKIAELVILDPLKKWTFELGDIFSKSINSPFINQKLIGKVDYTISKGYIFSSQE